MTSAEALDNAPPGYALNVFFNCPFDESYRELLHPALFTILYLGFEPRIATERLDSGEPRIAKICELIGLSRYSIHDLSRLKASLPGEIYRMNVPFELGIDYGARQYGPGFMSRKKCLILEKGAHDFKKALSDLSGIDIKNHDNRPQRAVRTIRDWFYGTVGVRTADYPTVIWNRFNDFTTTLFEERLAEGILEEDVIEDIKEMSVPEYIGSVKAWISENLRTVN